MTNKNDDKITEAGAVELDENELDQVTGGGSFDGKGNDLKNIKISDSGIKDGVFKDSIRKGPSGFATEEIKRVK